MTTSSSALGPPDSRPEAAAAAGAAAAFGRGRDQVAECRRPRAGAWDVAEEPRMIEMADVWQDVFVESSKEVIEVTGGLRGPCGHTGAHGVAGVVASTGGRGATGGLRGRCGQTVAHGVAGVGPQDGAVAQRLDPRDEHVD